VVFFRTRTGNKPVREWLRSLPKEQDVRLRAFIKKTQKRPGDELELARKRKSQYVQAL
jgi:hypothetical protein